MTRASKAKRLVARIVETRYDGEMVAEVRAAALVLRPLGCRRGGPSEVLLPWGLIYQHALIARATEAKRAKRRARKGGR